MLRKFSCVQLNLEQPVSDGGASPPVEARYQAEFYRACVELLGNLHTLPEWSGKERTGRVDFAIPSQGWVVECVREGSQLNEHIERFVGTGKYTPWLKTGQVQEFIMLDFRRKIPSKARGKYFNGYYIFHCSLSLNVGLEWLFHVVFAEDFSCYTIYDSNCQALPGDSNVALLQ